MRKIPERFKRCGIRIQCLNCRSEVTDTCHEKGKGIATCGHKETHRFKFVVHIPGTSSGKCTMLTKTENFNEVLAELAEYKEVLKTTNYCNESAKAIINGSSPIVPETIPAPEAMPSAFEQNEKAVAPVVPDNTKYLLADFAAKYLDFISGIDVPLHLKRNYSKDHINEIQRVLERFCAALDKHIDKASSKPKYDIHSMTLSDVKQDEIGVFCSYIKNDLNIKSYNKHCAIMKAFYNWCIDIKDCELKNPFEKMTLIGSGKKEKTAIHHDEFQNLLAAITYENGHATLTNGKKINHYHNWLPTAFRLALETGLRAEEVITLKFKDICELHKGVMAFKIINLKVWRIQTGGDEERIMDYTKFIPITASLKRLLLECGHLSYIGVDKYVIPFPEDLKLSNVQDIISRSFSHFIKLVTDRKIMYKDLRKTYITRITMALGNKAKLFTGHSDEAVIQKHYLADEALMGGLTHLNIFEDCA